MEPIMISCLYMASLVFGWTFIWLIVGWLVNCKTVSALKLIGCWTGRLFQLSNWLAGELEDNFSSQADWLVNYKTVSAPKYDEFESRNILSSIILRLVQRPSSRPGTRSTISRGTVLQNSPFPLHDEKTSGVCKTSTDIHICREPSA